MPEDKFRQGMVLFYDQKAGIIEEWEKGYRFIYDEQFIKGKKAISVSLPVTQAVHESPHLFPFFMGLLPEGWYLDIVTRKMKIDKNDAFGLLLSTCQETIGAVSVHKIGS